MTRHKLTVAVTGSTGQQGGHLARRMLDHGHRVRALTRNPETAASRALAARGAEIVCVDLDSGDNLTAALQGADAAFLVTTPFERGAEAEVEQANHFGEAARAVALPHLVYTSVTEPMTQSPVEHFAAKGRAERALRELGLPMTIVGAPPFLDNVIAPWHLPWLRRGIYAVPGPMDFPMQWVATEDIAAMAAHVLEERDAYVGQRLDIASDELSGREMMAALERATGRPLRHESKRFADLDPMLGRLFAAIDMPMPERAPGAKSGHESRLNGPPSGVELGKLHADFSHIGWHRFSVWAEKQDWPRLLGPPQGMNARAAT